MAIASSRVMLEPIRRCASAERVCCGVRPPIRGCAPASVRCSQRRRRRPWSRVGTRAAAAVSVSARAGRIPDPARGARKPSSAAVMPRLCRSSPKIAHRLGETLRAPIRCRASSHASAEIAHRSRQAPAVAGRREDCGAAFVRDAAPRHAVRSPPRHRRDDCSTTQRRSRRRAPREGERLVQRLLARRHAGPGRRTTSARLLKAAAIASVSPASRHASEVRSLTPAPDAVVTGEPAGRGQRVQRIDRALPDRRARGRSPAPRRRDGANAV